MKRKFQFKSIKTRFTFWFLFVALLPLIIVVKVNYDSRVKSIKNREISKLIAIRDLKVQQVNIWLDNKIGEIQSIADDHNIRQLENIFNNSEHTQNDIDILNNIRNNLNHYVENIVDFFEFFIIDPHSGQVELSTDKSLEGKDRSKRPYFIEPLRNGQIYIDTYYSKYLKKPAMTFSIPIHCLAHNSKHVTAILAARVDLEDSVYKMLLNETGMGETGETLIVDKNGVVLNELRWHENAPFRIKIKDNAVLRASQGDTGIVQMTDYREEKVLAAYTNISRSQWGFVVKQDLREIYAPIHLMFRHILILLVISVAAVYVIVVFITRNITRPVLEMTEVSKKIEKGELSARNHVMRTDEFGYLALSFNNMADSIMSHIAVQKGSADITKTMVAARELMDFGRELLRKLVEITGSNLGTFYVLNEDESKFESLTSIGVTPELQEPFDAQKCEGEFERVMATKKISRIHDIPEDTVFTIKTFIGTAYPKEIITIPLMVEDKVTAIISLAGLSGYSKQSLEILNQTWMGMNTAFSNQLASAEVHKLAEDLKLKNRQLQVQAEELEIQAKELQQKSEELQEQNTKLEAQRQQVEEANRLKSVFLSNMSHELRTPLNSIMALSHLLLMDAKQKLSQEEVKYLEIIERDGKNLLTLINDILDLSKIESGRMEVNLNLFSLASVIEEIVDRLMPIVRGKGIKINQDIPDNLPNIESDEVRTHQILQNIIENAVKFTEQGCVTISASWDAQKVYLKVSDTGIGIAKEDLQHIFTEFRRIDESLSSQYEGTGLGLAIASKAAKILGAQISAESELGAGSTFTLILPIRWPTKGERNESQTVTPSIKNQEEKKQKTLIEQYPKYPGSPEMSDLPTILIIEDNPGNMLTIKSILKDRYKILEAADGEEGLQMTLQMIPDLVLLDIALPKMDGFTVVRGIKDDKETCNIPVIALTAHAMKGDREKILGAGCDDYISKPLDPEYILRRISELVSQ